MVAMLYQARLFRIFSRLLTDPVYSSASQFQVLFIFISWFSVSQGWFFILNWPVNKPVNRAVMTNCISRVANYGLKIA